MKHWLDFYRFHLDLWSWICFLRDQFTFILGGNLLKRVLLALNKPKSQVIVDIRNVLFLRRAITHTKCMIIKLWSTQTLRILLKKSQSHCYLLVLHINYKSLQVILRISEPIRSKEIFFDPTIIIFSFVASISFSPAYQIDEYSIFL